MPDSASSPPPARQAEILADGVRGVRPRVPVNMKELETRARELRTAWLLRQSG